MKIKTQNLIGPALDWAVAKCEGVKIIRGAKNTLWIADEPDNDATEWSPSTNWAQGGPMIERGNITLLASCGAPWDATAYFDASGRWYRVRKISGPTPLIAVMRFYVANKLGDELKVPDEVAA